MAEDMRNRTPILSSKAGSSASSVSSQKPSQDIASCKLSIAHCYARSISDPSFSFSLAKISHDLTYGEWKREASERRYSRQLLAALSPFSGYHKEPFDD
jgi:hypothetical protein